MNFIEIDSIIKNSFVIVLVITLVLDTILNFYLHRHKYLISNYYYSLHNKLGFTKITFIKIAGAVFLIDGLIIEPSGKSGSIFTIITAYCIAVAKLFTDYRKTKIQQKLSNQEDTPGQKPAR